MDTAKELCCLDGSLRIFASSTPGNTFLLSKEAVHIKISRTIQFQIFDLADSIRTHKQDTSLGIDIAW